MIWFIFWVIGKTGQSSRSGSSRSSQGTYSPPRSRRQAPKSPDTYRPGSGSRRSSSIAFRESSASTGTTSAVPQDLSGLHDAFTGAPLDKALGLYQCQTCQVFYHQESVQVLREANSSACVSCQSTSIISVIPGAAPSGGRDYAPDVVTLSNYRDCPSSNKWYRFGVRLSECFAHHFHVTRRTVGSANGVSRWCCV